MCSFIDPKITTLRISQSYWKFLNAFPYLVKSICINATITCKWYVRLFLLDWLYFHAQTSDHPISLTIGTHQMQLSLSFELTDDTFWPSHLRFVPDRSNQNTCVTSPRHHLPSFLSFIFCYLLCLLVEHNCAPFPGTRWWPTENAQVMAAGGYESAISRLKIFTLTVSLSASRLKKITG